MPIIKYIYYSILPLLLGVTLIAGIANPALPADTRQVPASPVVADVNLRVLNNEQNTNDELQKRELAQKELEQKAQEQREQEKKELEQRELEKKKQQQAVAAAAKTQTAAAPETTVTASTQRAASTPSTSRSETPAPAPSAESTPKSTADSRAAALVSTAKQYLGVKYLWGGTTPAGFDCSGYLQYVYAQHGITLPRVSRDQYNAGTAVAYANLQPGDLVFFSLDGDQVTDHVGMFIGSGQFIHASSSKGVTISSFSSYWQPKYLGARRVL